MWSPINSLMATLALVDATGLASWALGETETLFRARYISCWSKTYVYYLWAIRLTSGVLVIALNSWMTLIIAITRYVVITKVSAVLAISHVKRLVLSAFVLSIIQYIPDALTVSAIKYEIYNKTCYHFSKGGVSENGYISQKTYFWLKFVFSSTPSVLLIVFSALIISVIYKGKRNHKSITNAATRGRTWANTTRTTIITLFIIGASVVARIPFLAFVVVSEFSGYTESETLFDNILYILVTMNGGLNIFFYMISKEFRVTLKNVLCWKYLLMSDKAANFDNSIIPSRRSKF